MKKLLVSLICSAVITFSIPCFSQVNPSHHTVKAYTKKDGTVVQKHEQTNSNKTKTDNYSHKGNTNPYTGKRGSKK